MGVFGCCAKFCGLVALLLAVLGGYLSQHKNPMGVMFRTVFQLQGIGKPGTEPVPADMKPMPRPAGEIQFDLPGGYKMPANGLGMCCRPTAYDEVNVHRTVLWYLLQGGRHIDTADVYLNHEPIGEAIKEAIARGIPRSEIFLTTKVFPGYFGYDESIAATKRMLKELQVDYIDLLLMHAPITIDPIMMAKYMTGNLKGVTGGVSNHPDMVKVRTDTWKGLSTLRDQGLVRSLGVSNFKIEHMQQIQALNLAPIAANQMQYHPWVPDWMKDIVKFCHDNSIVVTGYFSLGGHDHKDKLLGLDDLNAISKAHGRRSAQVLLRWSLQNNVSIIPGTGKHTHMIDNLGTYGFELSNDDMSKLNSLQGLPVSKDFVFFDL